MVLDRYGGTHKLGMEMIDDFGDIYIERYIYLIDCSYISITSEYLLVPRVKVSGSDLER